MTNPAQHHGWLSGTTLRAASATLALAAVLVSAVIAAQVAQAQSLTTLYSFCSQGGCTDGTYPNGGLVQATDGNLYGTTATGGANGVGTVFKITPSGTLTTLHSFNGTDGWGPFAGLVQATNGNFYGTTVKGGANHVCDSAGDGTVFKITPSGTLTTLHSFNCTDGAYPYAGLVQASNGDFYGTTEAGGASIILGTVFKITPSGTLTTLHSFDGTDGATPMGTLIQGTDGNFYGTTLTNTVFKITPSGTLTTLHWFAGPPTDGADPYAGVVQASDGNFYGTTTGGGASSSACPSGCGTVFKMTPSGTLTTLHSFDSTDGVSPEAALLQATDGDLYGTTFEGGTNANCAVGGCVGTIFKITPRGTLTTLYNFCPQTGCLDGGFPVAALIQDTNGSLYGTTTLGGADGDGTVFSLAVGLGPFVETKPTSGTEGTKIGILGQGFGSSSVVKFGGTTATTIVRSGTTFITATEPAGALTGAVTVTTGSTTLSSAQTFKVKPTLTSFAPPSGPVGTSVSINGTGLTQATRVAFNGTSAIFTVNSDILITATVPTGATTGKIAVTTKGGSATSTTSFTVN